ncbi:MAG TPA: hypothetical protein VF381_14595, partial [Thermoanaerobaculia bacterium]
NVGLLGSFFVTYTLLFVYATLFPEQTFYLFAVLPIRVRWLAYISAGVLAWGAFFGTLTNIAVAAGSLAGYVYFLLHRVPVVRFVKPKDDSESEPAESKSPDFTAVRNASRFVTIKKAFAAGNDGEIDRLLAQSERDIVRGVNICPPADFKPENSDGYCIRCEGFAECSARFIKTHRPPASAAAPAAPELPVTSS